MSQKTHYINGEWVEGKGSSFTSHNPANYQLLWRGNAATAFDIDKAVGAAQRAQSSWAEKSLEERYLYLLAYKAALESQKEPLAAAISQEVGKPLWEARSEVAAMIGKVEISYRAQEERCPATAGQKGSFTRHKPHGVLAVFGPFNFPGHLPSGHIVPALLAGNSLIFKPSELAPRVAEMMVKIWEQSGLPAGVINLVQGGKETGMVLSQHPDINGLLFTGSWKTGRALSELFCDQPSKILALEMGGNNPLVVAEVEDLTAAAYLTIQSAFITSGQRCSCARRLILPATPQREAFIDTLIEMTKKVRIGPYNAEPEPFMGPLINNSAANTLIAAQEWFLQRGGKALLPMRRLTSEGAFLSPGIIDVTPISHCPDEELFGPLLQLTLVSSFDEALAAANATTFGLTAGLLSDSEELFRRFYRTVRAGIINWNSPTTGALSAAPFGGVGNSGNHRPGAYYAADYCSYPVASFEAEKVALPSSPTPGIEIAQGGAP